MANNPIQASHFIGINLLKLGQNFNTESFSKYKWEKEVRISLSKSQWNISFANAIEQSQKI